MERRATNKPIIFCLALASAALFGLTACSTAGSGSAKMGDCVPGKSLGSSPAGLSQVELCVASKGKVHKFTAEIAATSQQQAQGMMFRTEMADNTAMIFPFESERIASFWMKNTQIPLDIIFIRSDGKIENVAENTPPFSEESVFSSAPVVAVVEIRGGLASERGVGPGDLVRWEGN